MGGELGLRGGGIPDCPGCPGLAGSSCSLVLVLVLGGRADAVCLDSGWLAGWLALGGGCGCRCRWMSMSRGSANPNRRRRHGWMDGWHRWHGWWQESAVAVKKTGWHVFDFWAA
ncbi:uncharacterized protein RAG0_01207 [Rhynchosporium agropyri]|uniref:Uncharacterized protein n=1 Tax=Rhynchosporium agropyri TaxID=914238 RepID=A0A1E1JW82_9HELO|nr:uncharacterized protein RAG0_01207 [Rhynchosporium agropyri]